MLKEPTHLNREQLGQQFSEVLQEQLELLKAQIKKNEQHKTSEEDDISLAKQYLAAAKNAFEKLLYLGFYENKQWLKKNDEQEIRDLESKFYNLV